MASRVVVNTAELARLLESPDSAVATDLLRRAFQVSNAAKRMAAVDTGRLRSSITQEVSRDAQGLVARIGTDVEYAPFVEFGTRYMAPQPFLRPALGAARG